MPLFMDFEIHQVLTYTPTTIYVRNYFSKKTVYFETNNFVRKNGISCIPWDIP